MQNYFVVLMHIIYTLLDVVMYSIMNVYQSGSKGKQISPNLNIEISNYISFLIQYKFRKNTCPECRNKTTSSTVIRLFVNIADSSYIENSDDPPDLISLQNENDNLKFRLMEKDGAIKSKDESLEKLKGDNKKLSSLQTQSRTVILALENKLEQNKIIANAHNDQVRINS